MKPRPTVAEIRLDRAARNLIQARACVGEKVKICAVVKANAYGHGAVALSGTFVEAGAKWLGVAVLEEGIELREAGIEAPILLLNGLLSGQAVDAIEYRLTPVIYSHSILAQLNTAAGQRGMRVQAHLKIDTGMGRLGLLPHAVEDFVAGARAFGNVELGGVLSHFADAEGADSDYTRRQTLLFSELVGKIQSQGLTLSEIHIANSASVLAHPETHFTMARPGIMLYGVHPSPAVRTRAVLEPVMSLKSEIVMLKTLSPGESVSYGRTYRTSRETRVATVPIGYGDGLSRLLSNRGAALVRGKRCPIIGRVTMDLTMLDVTEVPDSRTGDEAVLIGEQGSERIGVEEVADCCGTIPYEILCAISGRVPRRFLSENTPARTA